MKNRTANCELRTANCELRTANCELRNKRLAVDRPSFDGSFAFFGAD